MSNESQSNKDWLANKIANTPPSGKVTPNSGYIDSEGYVINPSDKIILHFAGGPLNMPLPWILVKAEDKFSSVNYAFNPSVTVRAANGVEKTYDFAQHYSPMPYEVYLKYKEWEKEADKTGIPLIDIIHKYDKSI